MPQKYKQGRREKLDPERQRLAQPQSRDWAWPVGSVFISVVSTNPATLLGFGTWSAIAAGRVLVGIDSGDTDFDAAEETGGAKTVAGAGSISGITISDHPQHDHVYSDTVDVASGVGEAGVTVGGKVAVNTTGYTHTVASQGTFTGSATSVVQPYFVVYMWKRTA